MIYAVCVAIGATVALFALRLVPPDDGIPTNVARTVRIAALVGAVLGAYLFELPADLFGWAPRALEPGEAAARHMVLGRTVLGGILGGWIAVELAKWRLGYRGATGDRFAMPLALGLTFGRLGCVLTGCCPGVPIDESSPWARLSVVHHDPPRFPATLVESWFHAVAACGLLAMAWMGVLRGRRLALYVAAYAVARFALEEWRADPEVWLGLSYYQWLAIPLFAIAAGTAAARWRAAT